MAKETMHYSNKPNSKNTLHDIVVDIAKVDVITPETILKTLHRDNRNKAIICAVMSMFFFGPILCCIFFYNETFRWYYAILPLAFFCIGISMLYSLITDFSKTRKRKENILHANFIVKESRIQSVYSEYNSAAESDDYFIEIDDNPKNWINVPDSIYNAVQKDKTCYMLYLLEDGQNVLFLIYVGKCNFDTGLM